MTQYTYEEQVQELIEKIQNADAILIGASNGFSISEGLHLFAENQAFVELFGDFRGKYGIHNILQGYFAKYPLEEVKWAFSSRLAHHYSGNYTGSENTDALKRIIGKKPYFMVTSNGENHFELAGFNAENIYEIEGSWKYMQCEKPCHKNLYPAFHLLRDMATQESDGKIPSSLVPQCPKCGGPMMLHVAVNDAFIPDGAANIRFQQFINKYKNQKLVVLELGIGWRNQMIKAPLMNLVAREPQAVYVTINKGEIYIPDQIVNKSYGLDGDITKILRDLAEAMEC